ncbi:hypothetical protein H5P28_17780 [Ruficoccus amylovorans]|uniref:Replication-associated protein ORF2/G2P domain-containing protein n=2 Tax=Ruficoccus amylovorans TaxID=1804625 RepID=A0A842HI83_9BACT|nr:hypothetical protein [Ruficoccus amylovorans]MBC2596122.1 hypothetical protein [Ruficoccus amylovorans]
MKQHSGGFKLDEVRASKNFRHFMNILNKKTFGKAFQRFGKRISVVPVMENSENERLHFHALLQCPDKYSSTAGQAIFALKAQSLWKKTHFGYDQTSSRLAADEGWTGYITKLKGQADQIDWENFHWN